MIIWYHSRSGRFARRRGQAMTYLAASLLSLTVGLLSIVSKEKRIFVPEPERLNLSIEWPVKSPKGKKISSTFAESRYDHFHNGLDIPIYSAKVSPVQKGEVLWIKNPKRRLDEVPFGGGKSVILKHESIWSGYMHLKNIDSDVFSKKTISTDDTVGLSGKTGHSGGAHLHFFIFNSGHSTFYNPLHFIPKGFIKDTRAPVLKKYTVASSEKGNTKKANRVPDGTLLARIEDKGVYSEKWGVYYLKVYDEAGKLLKNIQFDSVKFAGHNWVSSNGLSFHEIYGGNQYLLHKAADKTLKWEAGGFTGPAISAKYQP